MPNVWQVVIKNQGVTVRTADWLPLRVPVIVTERVVVTVLLVTVKVAVVEPAATVTLEGTVATVVLLLERVTEIPFDGAGPFRLTVPVDVVPPLTEVGFSVSRETLGAVTVKRLVLVVPA